MKILRKRTKPIKKSFIVTCEKNGLDSRFGRGCGAILEVFAKDCYSVPVNYDGDNLELAFLCAECGLELCPKRDFLDFEYHNKVQTYNERQSYTPLTEENTPPWNPYVNFPTRKEWCETNKVEIGFR